MAKYLNTLLLSAYIVVVSATPATVITASHSSAENCKQNPKAFLEIVEKEQAGWDNKVQLALWAYESNLTEHNLREKVRVSSEAANYRNLIYDEIQKCQWEDLQDEDMQRRFSYLSDLGTAALPPEV